jgi:hypothetical protein
MQLLGSSPCRRFAELRLYLYLFVPEFTNFHDLIRFLGSSA